MNRLSKPSVAKFVAAIIPLAVFAGVVFQSANRRGRPEPNTVPEKADHEVAAVAMRQLEHERELQQVRNQAAKQIAEAEAKAIKAQHEVQASQGADFQAGAAAGKAQAEAAFDDKLELARTREFERGRTLGAAEVEVDAIERGRKVGEEIGRLKAKDEARKELDAELKLAIERTRSETHAESFKEGFSEGKGLAQRTARLETSIPGICLAIGLVTLGFYVLLRRGQVQLEETYKEGLSRRDSVEELKLRLLVNQSQHALGQPGESCQ